MFNIASLWSGGKTAGSKSSSDKGLPRVGSLESRVMTRPLSIGAKTTRLDTVELPPRPEMLKAPPRPIGKSLAPSGGLPIPSTRPRLIARVFGPVRR